MLVVGLTGGIASGKSTVSSLLASHRIPIIDADILAREVVAPGTKGFKLIVDHFGRDRILRDDGGLDRAALGEIVFKDGDERRWLNGVIHPRVRREMVRRLVSNWLTGEWCTVVDVPLLIEAGFWKFVGEVVVVFVNEKLQLSRLLARPSDPPLSPEQAKSRIASQLSLSEKLHYASQVIDNSGTFADLESQVDRLVSRWRSSQGGRTGWWWRICWFLPPVGLTAGLICLGRRWWYMKRKGGRRRSRGEVSSAPRDSRRGRDGPEGETVEMRTMGDASGRRRMLSGDGKGQSILD